jgi:hypothetical protein
MPMPEAQPPLVLAQRHYNHQLFADRYLDVTLPGRTAWRSLLDEARPVLARVQAILAGYKPSTNEAQTERIRVTRRRFSISMPSSGGQHSSRRRWRAPAQAARWS